LLGQAEKSQQTIRRAWVGGHARYIERNPIRAQITTNPLTYRWSSFSFYARGAEDAIIKTINPLYLELAKTEEERQEKYYRYILEERPYEHIVDKGLRIR